MSTYRSLCRDGHFRQQYTPQDSNLSYAHHRSRVVDATAVLLRNVRETAHQVSQVRDVRATISQDATVIQRDTGNEKASETLEVPIEQLVQASVSAQQLRAAGLASPKSNCAANRLKYLLSTGLPAPTLTPGG